MIPTLYPPFQHWAEKGSVYILSDLHFVTEGKEQQLPDWIMLEEQLARINKKVQKNDTFVCLGDVGEPEYVKQIRAGKKILLLGNHDARGRYKEVFDEVYAGPLFIADKILLSHEPVGVPFALNIHGHDHGWSCEYKEDCYYLNLAANVCDFTPVNLGTLIRDGALAKIQGIHELTIDRRLGRGKSE